MIILAQKQTIILRHIDGLSNRAIAKELHISKDTVNKYIKEYENQKAELVSSNPQMDTSELIQSIVEKPKYNTNGRKPTKVTPEMMKFIEDCLELNRKKRFDGRRKQVMKKIDIHEELIEKGFDISYSTVKRLVNEFEQREREAYIRQEYNLGDECEFDWGEVKLDIGEEGYKKYQMAVFTPAKSNYRFAVLFRSQDSAAFQQAHAEFFDHCKGSYKTMVYDNMKVAVKRFVGRNEKEPTVALTQLSLYYGFHFRFCNIASGNEKGHVERSVEFVRRKAFRIRDRFDTLADANNHLLEVCLGLNNQKLSDKRIPAQILAMEKEYLNPHIPKFESCIVSESKVGKYSTITISQNHYSVPDNLVGKILLTKTYTDKIIVYHNNEVVAVHHRSYRNHDWVIELKHYLKTLYKKPGALSHSTALLQADTKIKNIYESYYSKDAKTFLEVLEIVFEKGVDQVQKAIEKLIKISPLDMSAQKIRSICDHTYEIDHAPRKIYTDSLSEKSRETLSIYNQLIGLRSKKEVH